MTEKLNIVAISGKAGVGKDFLAQKVLRAAGYIPFSFAWHFKIWLVAKGMATHEEVFVTKPPHVRKLLQEEGTERGRMLYGHDIWCNTTLEWFTVLNENCGINKFCIPDCRFINEVEFVKAQGGTVIRIEAPDRVASSSLTDEQKAHISETALDNFTDFDIVISNPYGTTVRNLCNQLESHNIISEDDYFKTW